MKTQQQGQALGLNSRNPAKTDDKRMCANNRGWHYSSWVSKLAALKDTQLHMSQHAIGS